MMTERANSILVWTSTEGTQRAFIIVTDESKDEDDIERQRLELCSFDSETEQWVTEEKIDHIAQVNDFGIPEALVD